jgi:hypothetical protein
VKGCDVCDRDQEHRGHRCHDEPAHRERARRVLKEPVADQPQGSLKDFEFSRPTMELRWQQGLADARTTLQASPWLAPMPGELGVRVFDVIHDMLTADAKLSGNVQSFKPGSRRRWSPDHRAG